MRQNNDNYLIKKFYHQKIDSNMSFIFQKSIIVMKTILYCRKSSHINENETYNILLVKGYMPKIQKNSDFSLFSF